MHWGPGNMATILQTIFSVIFLNENSYILIWGNYDMIQLVVQDSMDSSLQEDSAECDWRQSNQNQCICQFWQQGNELFVPTCAETAQLFKRPWSGRHSEGSVSNIWLSCLRNDIRNVSAKFVVNRIGSSKGNMQNCSTKIRCKERKRVFRAWPKVKSDLAPVPLTIFRSNSKFDQNLQHSGIKCPLPITTKFCTYHDSITVAACEKFCGDRLNIF